MATIAEVSRQRKAQLRQLLIVSRKLDAKQETLEREVKRLINRKKSVPELADAERLTGLALAVDSELQNMANVIMNVGNSWGMQI